MQSNHTSSRESNTATLGRYELLLPVARGGMATVWAARLKGAKGFQKVVALKSMLSFLSDDPRFEEMFLAEAKYAARIEHPNVCSILDLGEHDGQLYIVMDWVDGEALSELRKASAEGRLPVAFAARIAIDAAMGLHAAHKLKGAGGESLGLVHCDVSPQNILVTFDGVVKIVDFGLAKATLGARPAYGDDGLVGGKMAYMAPEQAAGREVDRRCDVFALGLVAYEMLTGTHPYRAETPLATLQRIRDDVRPIASPRDLRPECPVAVSDAVLRALAKDPAHRFPTILAFAKALERALSDMAGVGRRRDDLAAFVQSALGDRARRRRAAIADALRVADRAEGEPRRGGEVPPPSPSTRSALMRPPTWDVDPAGPSTFPEQGVEADWLVRGATLDTAPASRPGDRNVPSPPPSTAPVALSQPAPPRRRATPLVAFGATVVLGLGAVGAIARVSPPAAPAAATVSASRPSPVVAARPVPIEATPPPPSAEPVGVAPEEPPPIVERAAPAPPPRRAASAVVGAPRAPAPRPAPRPAAARTAIANPGF